MRKKITNIANTLVNEINYWKTVKLDPTITKKNYNVDITTLTSKEVKTIRRDIFRYNMVKKYPFLSISFLTMLWFKHLDFKENPESFLLDYFNKYSNTMFKVNMLNSSIYLTKKFINTTVNLIGDTSIEDSQDKLVIDVIVENNYDFKTNRYNKTFVNEEKEIIVNKDFSNVDSITLGDSNRKLVLSYLSKSLIEEINSNIKKDIEAKIDSNEGLSLKQVVNIIDILQEHKSIVNIDYSKTKNYKLEFANIFYEDEFELNNELIEEIQIEDKIKVLVNKNKENQIGVFILISEETKKWFEKQILEFDFNKLSNKEKLNILSNIY